MRESCYHCIEGSVANFLTALMWRRLLNSAALATPTHRRPKRVFEETSTRVVAWMINKWRAKIVQRELYNVRDPPWRRDRRIERESTVVIKAVSVTNFK